MKHPVFRIVLVSLCALIVLGATLLIALAPHEPIDYPDAAYTATEISQMFPGFLYFDFGYNPNCSMVYAPSADELPKAFAQKKKVPDASESVPQLMGYMQGFPPPEDKRINARDGSFFEFPALRYSIVHMREFMPTVNVPRGNVTAPAPLQKVPLCRQKPYHR